MKSDSRTNLSARTDDSRTDDSALAGLAERKKTRTALPPLFKVFILNDDYTPMDFVVNVLETVFNKSSSDATKIMLHVHRKGAGLCGVYSFDVAETKVAHVLALAHAAQHPLQCRMEKE